MSRQGAAGMGLIAAAVGIWLIGAATAALLIARVIRIAEAHLK